MINSPLLQIIVLAAVAIFLIVKLRSVLGTRDGFEPKKTPPQAAQEPRRDFEVIDGGPDHDIVDHVAEKSGAAEALADMKAVDPSFTVGEFLHGAKGAYEWILMAFERGELDEIAPFLDEEVMEAFSQVVEQRREQGLTVAAEFVGIREASLADAVFDADSNRAEITVRFVGELTSVVKNADGEVVEGKADQIRRQKDSWTFERVMGSDDPNWRLVATDE